jgi:hypothetical protein
MMDEMTIETEDDIFLVRGKEAVRIAEARRGGWANLHSALGGFSA